MVLKNQAQVQQYEHTRDLLTYSQILPLGEQLDRCLSQLQLFTINL